MLIVNIQINNELFVRISTNTIIYLLTKTYKSINGNNIIKRPIFSAIELKVKCIYE